LSSVAHVLPEYAGSLRPRLPAPKPRRFLANVPKQTTREPLIDHLSQLRALFDDLPADHARQAFSHAAWVDERSASYERLAFLGDSVLGLAVSKALFPRFAGDTAGRLTKIRAQVVSRRSCATLAEGLDVPGRMRAVMPEGQTQAAEALTGAESVLAEAVEAGIGACFLEFGFERTADALADALAPQIDHALSYQVDFKSALQERLARRGDVVIYRVVDEQGPPHDRRFETVAEVAGRPIGTGAGRSKKESEQEAAKEALERLQES
jgi:ribonuclease III